MFCKTKLAVVGLVMALGSTPAVAQASNYEERLMERCFGKFVGDPAGYELCRRGCRDDFPPQFQFAPTIDVKLD